MFCHGFTSGETKKNHVNHWPQQSVNRQGIEQDTLEYKSIALSAHKRARS
jgi:hypothetical protein